MKKALIMLNSTCNVTPRCKHCYIAYNQDRSLSNVIEIIKRLKKDNYQILLAGSEVLLNLDYLKAYQLVNQKYLYTNGIIISQNPEILNAIKLYGIEELRFSLHFGITGKLGSVTKDIVFRAIKHAKESGFKVGIVVVITQDNYKHAQEMCDQAFALGATYIEFIRFIKCGLGKTLNQKTLDEGQRSDFFSLIDKSKAKYGSRMTIKVFCNFGPEDGKEQRDYCPAGKDLFVVGPNDNIYGCTFLFDFPIGKLTKQGIKITKELCKKRDKCVCDYLVK